MGKFSSLLLGAVTGAAAAPVMAPNNSDENFPMVDLLSYFLNNFEAKRKADKPAVVLTVPLPADTAFLLSVRA